MLVVEAREKFAKCLKISVLFLLKCSLLYHERINWDMFTEVSCYPLCVYTCKLCMLFSQCSSLTKTGQIFLHHITPRFWAALVWKSGFMFPEIFGECDGYS